MLLADQEEREDRAEDHDLSTDQRSVQVCGM